MNYVLLPLRSVLSSQFFPTSKIYYTVGFLNIAYRSARVYVYIYTYIYNELKPV